MFRNIHLNVCIFIQVKIKSGVRTCMHRLLKTVVVMFGKLSSLYHTSSYQRKYLYDQVTQPEFKSNCDRRNEKKKEALRDLPDMNKNLYLYLNSLAYYLM